MQEAVSQLAGMLDACERAVVFTGAGISTESGIADFRSPDGIWAKMEPIYFQDFVASEEARRESWRRKLISDREMVVAEPNRGHRAVAELVRRDTVSSVVTQNIDGLHQKSGIPGERVIELHGNATYARCLNCGTRYELEPIMSAFAADETLPICDKCDGDIKTATVSFGQPMPQVDMARAEQESKRCDLFIAIGSSLVVYPAAALPGIAKTNGASLVILNREPTDLDRLADLVLHAEIGETLGAVVGVN